MERLEHEIAACFCFLLSDWSTLCPTPNNHKQNVLSVSFSSFLILVNFYHYMLGLVFKLNLRYNNFSTNHCLLYTYLIECLCFKHTQTAVSECEVFTAVRHLLKQGNTTRTARLDICKKTFIV